MRHKGIAMLALLCASLAGIGQVAQGQQSKVTEEKGIAGYLNPKTGAFTPMAHSVADAEAFAAVVPTTGKFVFSFTITVSSTVPKNGLVSCQADAVVFEASSGQTINDRVAGFATKGTGSTWTCSLTMPYSWILASPSTDMAMLSYHIGIEEALQATATNGTAILVTAVSLRDSQQNIGSIKIPTSGSTTTETIAATI